jgi:DNA-binding XRE family transcriptional regulator
MAQLTSKQKKEWAKTVYLNEHLTQKEIAEKVGVSAKTMYKWIASEKWETLKTSLTITREEQLANLYRQVAAINDSIAKREEGKRYADSREADIINKLATAINKMETETGLADVISVCKKILTWLRPVDPGKAKEVSYLLDSFIKDLLR